MDLSNFTRTCHEKVNLNAEFLLTACDPKDVSYIQPFCTEDNLKPIIGYIYVIIIYVLF